MRANEIMTTDVKVIRPNSTLQEAAKEMRNLDVGALPVCDGERLIGMLTDRDIAVRAVADGKDPGSTTARECMSPDIIYCYDDAELEDARNIMEKNQIRRLPVISREKQLVGILAVGDLAIKTDETAEIGKTVREISEAAPS